jgi:hypothetical protein
MTARYVGLTSTFDEQRQVINAIAEDVDLILTAGSGGIGSNVSGASGFSYIEQAGKVVTSNIVFDSTNSGSLDSYILLAEKTLTISSGVGVTVGQGKVLIVDVLDLPLP